MKTMLRILLGASLLGTLPASAALGQVMAFRHSGPSCFGSQGSLTMVDLYSSAVPIHDWAAKSMWAPSGSTPIETKIFCPVAIHVPLEIGTPIDGARVVYSTMAPFTNTLGASITPEISSCSAYLMDSTAGGTWSMDSPSPGAPIGDNGEHNPGNTGSFYTNGIIVIRGGAAIPMGSGALNRMLITCQIPRTHSPNTGGGAQGTVLIKGYEVTYRQ